MPTRATTNQRAFSITELLIVIAIIALLVAILFPALAGVRVRARELETTRLINDILTAAQTFRTDTGRLPGYFTADEMGADANGGSSAVATDGAGLSAMENVLLDLAGTEAIWSEADNPDQTVWLPTSPYQNVGDTGEIFVNPDLIGAGEGDYLRLSSKFFAAQPNSSPTEAAQQGDVARGQVGAEGERQIPDVVDAFGTPLLVWSADTGRSGTLTRSTAAGPADNFARTAYDPNDNTIRPARFYWNANAAFLKAPRLGREQRNMLSANLNDGEPTSLLGGAVRQAVSDQGMEELMEAFFGNPSYPDEATLIAGADIYNQVWAREARGDFIVHSAGRDGIYVSTRDRQGAGVIADSAGATGTRPNLRYALSFVTGPGGTRLTDDDGRFETRDLLAGFDDIFIND